MGAFTVYKLHSSLRLCKSPFCSEVLTLKMNFTLVWKNLTDFRPFTAWIHSWMWWEIFSPHKVNQCGSTKTNPSLKMKAKDKNQEIQICLQQHLVYRWNGGSVQQWHEWSAEWVECELSDYKGHFIDLFEYDWWSSKSADSSAKLSDGGLNSWWHVWLQSSAWCWVSDCLESVSVWSSVYVHRNSSRKHVMLYKCSISVSGQSGIRCVISPLHQIRQQE